MRRSIRGLLGAARRRVHRIWRVEYRAARRWLETTENLLHLGVVLLVPLLLAFVTWLANVTPFVSFLVYPPLASGTYTLFADPDSEYSTPGKFVGGMTLGALCGWLALEVTSRYWYLVPPEEFRVHAGATALSIALTGALTWALDLEEPSAFSAALLALVSGSNELVYVAGIAVSSAIVAGAFAVWYDAFYTNRARYLYQTVQSDDRVLVPIRGPEDDETAVFAAYLAAAHEAGKVVLYATVPEADGPDDATNPAPASGTAAPRLDPDDAGVDDLEALPSAARERLGRAESAIADTVDVPVEVVVLRGDPDDPRTVLTAAREVDCDLIVAGTDLAAGDDPTPSEFLVGLFRGDVDVIGFHSTARQTSWSRVLVMVRAPGELAHAMLDFARRLTPSPGNVTACTCIASGSERAGAASMLRDLASSFAAPFETRVTYGTPAEYLASNTAGYDLAMIGASSDRGRTSRFVSPPTFETLDDVECDLAIVHRA